MINQSGSTLRSIVEYLQLRADPELFRVTVLAEQVQKYRADNKTSSAQGEVSRTSLLHACGLAQPLVFSLLIWAGLDRRSWEQDLGVQEAKFELPPGTAEQWPDILVDETFMRSALERYAEEFVGRAVDALGLAWGILSQRLVRGSVGSRLQHAGLDQEEAAKLIGEEIAASLGLAPIAGLERYRVTPIISAALARAKRLARERGPRVPLTASLLLVGLIEEGADSADNTTTALLQQKLRAGSQDQYASIVNEYLAWYGERTSQEVEIRWMTRRVGEIFESARTLAVATRRLSLINARSLIGAILGYRPPAELEPLGAHILLEKLGSSVEKMTQDLLEYLRQNAPTEGSDNIEAWEDFFNSSEDRESGPANVARVDGEGLGGQDLLRIDSDVKAFALLLASANLTPPLAIGLFGNWGAGKSFFMRKLFEQIELLAQEAEKKRNQKRQTPFHGQIVQIEFNAWHYAETSLWASLVTHIFESLHRHFAPRNVDERKRWEELLRKLAETTLKQADAETVLAQAEAELEQAKTAHDQKELELSNAVNVAWQTIKDSLDTQEKKALTETLGLSNLDNLKGDLLRRHKEAVELRDRGILFRQSFLRMLGKPSSLWPSAVVLALVVAGVFLLSRSGSDAVQRAGASIAEVVAFVGGISTWLASAFRKASGVFGSLEKFEARVREQIEGSEATKSLRKAEESVAQSREKLEERQAQVSTLRAEIEGLRPTQRLLHFLEDRAGSSDYRKHLGLPALVRRDFEELQKLVNQEIFLDRAEAEKDLDSGAIPVSLQDQIKDIDLPLASSVVPHTLEPGWRWEVEDEERRFEIERPTPDADKLRCRVLWKNLPRIDRIVLYIDDLDRCPPPRVVEVLQAIQLLLALPLFVVVVGVDARWVKKSLNVRYQDLWRSESDSEGATPQDYIEKIFQIPFWLEPLRPESTRRYLAGLLGRNSVSSPGRRATVLQQAGPSLGSPSETESRPGTSVEKPADNQETNLAQASIFPAVSIRVGRPSEAESEPLPSLLEIEPLEQDFILKLAPLVGRSPRTVKRFLNIYRLYRASRARGRLNTFLGTEDSPGPFREAMLLLGLLTADSEIAPQLFSYLRDSAKGMTLEESLNGLDKSLSFTSSPTWTWTEKALRDLIEALSKDKAAPLNLNSLRSQLRDAARFSFLEMPPL